MKITNCGSGLHQREVKCARRLTDALPDNWYAFSNLDLVLGRGNTREVDLIIVSDHYIFVVDVKDWNGKIESQDGNWVQNGKDRGPSPVKKITEIKRKIFEKLQSHIKSTKNTRSLAIPRVHGLVLITGNADFTKVSELESDSIYELERFIKLLKGKQKLREHFGNVPSDHINKTLLDKQWKNLISNFFNTKTNSNFASGRKRFQGFIADDAPTFIHPNQVYSEFDAREESTPLNTTTLRLWDFAQCADARFQTEEGRNEIAGRERNVFHWLRDINSFSEKYLLTPTAHDPEKSVNYWEAFERRQNQKRLSEFVRTEVFRLNNEERLELVRQSFAAVATLHDCGAAHLDIGAHSIWLEAPTSVKLSHLLASHTPDGPTLGNQRYNFLSSVKLPEDFLELDSSPQCKDVYLTGIAAHSLLFGQPPKGIPPEWDPLIDKDQSFLKLHPWFSSILELNPSERIKTCSDALSILNKLTASSPSSVEIIQEIEECYCSIKSQIEAARSFPVKGEMIKDTNSVQAWITDVDGVDHVVKIWKQATFGDLKINARKIRSFLERAKNYSIDRPTGLAKISKFSWLQDAILITQEWVNGETLESALSQSHRQKFNALRSLQLAKNLLETVDALHSQNIVHGDLRPSNVIVGDDEKITFIDHLDFEFEMDGARSVSEYTPTFGGIFERDRFAAIVMCRRILADAQDDVFDLQKLEERAESCIKQEPALATTEPFLKSIEAEITRIISPTEIREITSLCLSVAGAEIGILEADEGKFYFRFRESGDLNFLHIRGAFEDLMVAVSRDWSVKWIRRQKLLQTNIMRRTRDEFYSHEMSIEISDNSHDSFSALETLIKDLEIVEKITDNSSPRMITASDNDDELEGEEEIGTDTDADSFVEKVFPLSERENASKSLLNENIDVPKLWRRLVEYEEQLSIEGRALGSCSYDERIRLTRIPFELELGQFDFDREDKVVVSKALNDGKWLKIGQLDTRQSRADIIYLNSFFDKGKLFIEDDSRLKFDSFFAGESLRRRKEAVGKILGSSGRSSDLLSALDTNTGFRATEDDCEIDEAAISGYGLNRDQETALRGIILKRPLGLVQGPPGTGKTRLIAALTHYALSHNLARSVLISSQSHEAVNTSVEGVLKHFAREGEKPSVLRVGANESSVSINLQQYFSKRIEQKMKDQFSASFRDRVSVAAQALGIPTRIAEKVAFIETSIHDVAKAISKLLEYNLSNEAPDKSKINSLLSTMERQLESQGLQNVEVSDDIDWSEFTNSVIAEIQKSETRTLGIGDDKIHRLRSIVHLAKDFVGSTTSASRSFEPFLAGTRHIVAGTCVGLGRRSLGLTDMAFDLVIVDEAARCTSSELLVPLQAARWTVLVGDHAQLQPHHEPGTVEAVAKQLKILPSQVMCSDFERIFKSEYAATASFSMRQQYRMLPAINQLVSETFYQNLELTAGRIEAIIPDDVLPDSLQHEVTWLQTDNLGANGFDKLQDGGSSRINEAEAEAVISLLEKWCEKPEFAEWLVDTGSNEPKIGIICMYAAQRDLVRRKLNTTKIGQYLDQGIKIGTVDSYQGKENLIVILSLVRNNRMGVSYNGRPTIREGFLATPNRINVAFSRAMDRLVIVGSRKSWRLGTPIQRAASSFENLHSEDRATIIKAEDIIK